LRVVLDTNVLVSALVFPGGRPETVYQLALQGSFELVTSVPLLTELGRILTVKFGRDDRAAQEAVGQIARAAELVEPHEEVDDIDDDPDDNRVLEAALTAHADVIVTGDHHLLALEVWRGIRIETPALFLERGFE
jgi:putative PIN family toxin of toxin-antitoxin system